MEHNHNHHGHDHGHDHSHDSHHAHVKTEADAAIISESPETFAETLTERDIAPAASNFFADMARRLTHSITTGELILFIAAIALIPIFLYEMNTPEILGSHAIWVAGSLPFIFFAIATYFNKDEARPIGIFFHSAAAIGLIMGATVLLPMIGTLNPALMGFDGTAVGMPLLTILFLFIAARVPNTGASYLLGATSAIIMFFYQTAALVTLPCVTETYGGNPQASAYCQVTPVLANIFLPLAFYILGYFAYTKRAK